MSEFALCERIKANTFKTYYSYQFISFIIQYCHTFVYGMYLLLKFMIIAQN